MKHVSNEFHRNMFSVRVNEEMGINIYSNTEEEKGRSDYQRPIVSTAVQ